MSPLREDDVEKVTLEQLAGLGYQVRYGPDLEPGQPGAERTDPELRDVVLDGRLRRALARLNPDASADSLESARQQLLACAEPNLLERNRALHRLLTEGITAQSRNAAGELGWETLRILDFDDPAHNDWLAVNQFTVREGQHHRRPDVVLFVNGLPLAVIELKNPADEQATLWTAHNQLQIYQREIPALFGYNAGLVVSDGVKARLGPIGAGREWFKPWRTIGGDEKAGPGTLELPVLLAGVFDHRRLLDLIRHFTVFERQAGGVRAKKIAGYHQFHAVNVAIAETLRAARSDQRIGVVWHTQGSGKSLTMVFYAGRLKLHPAMENPTIVVLTDRNDLDDQLFATFAACQDVLREPPVQASGREDLRERLRTAAGGVIFTTIQKFFTGNGGAVEELTARRNVVVIADEAHRSQYDFADGLAAQMRKALPNASFIGFTGTPIELADRDTRRVFGDYISIYDIQRSVADNATVPIYYESRLAKLELREDERPRLDPDFEEATEGEEVERKEQLKTRWAQLEALVGARERVEQIARDLLVHFDDRLGAMRGKAMIVCTSRRICVDLYDALIRLRPALHADDAGGALKVVMTGGNADPPEWQQHIRNKPRREELARRFRDPDDPFQMVIVRDMWLTGFDAPSLHTMYLDKPMRGHGLMQAIARVNRVFRDKPGGLVVDYLGVADELRKAIVTYTDNGGKGRPQFDQQEAVAKLREQYEICHGLFHGFDWSAWAGGSSAAKLALLPPAQDHVYAQPQGKERLRHHVRLLSHWFALAVPHPDALRIRDDVGFFQAVRAEVVKDVDDERRTDYELDHAIRQIVSGAIASSQPVDIFSAAGLKRPDISVLSDQFLAEVRAMPQRNLAAELLAKLLRHEIKARSRSNLVQSRSFREMLEHTLQLYQNRAIETAQVIEQLIELAKAMRAAQARGEALHLTHAELAFYDALETNDSAVKVLGEPVLCGIARELADVIRKNATLDWTLRESVRARLRVLVRRTLRRHGYPPDKQEKATATVLEQAEALASLEADQNAATAGSTSS